MIAGGLIFTLAIAVAHLWFRDDDRSDPVSEPYYIKAQKDEGWIEKLAGDPVALFTLVLTGATIGLYLATRSLWVATDRLVINADKASERQLRAYVFPDIVELKGYGSSFPKCKVGFKNYGQTPAYDVQVAAWLGVVDYPPTEPPEYPKRTRDGEEGFLGPGGHIHLIIETSEAVDEKRPLLLSKKSTLLLSGVIYYRDAFRIERTTKFCHYRMPPAGGGHVYVDGPMSVLNKWNYAD